MTTRRWQDWLNLALGAWLFLSPWLMQYGDFTGAAWNAHLLGLAIMVFAAWALYKPSPWQEVVSMAFGVWLALSPWAIGFNGQRPIFLNAVIVGLLVIAMAAWAMLRDIEFDKWWHRATS